MKKERKIIEFPESWGTGDIISAGDTIYQTQPNNPSKTFGHHYFAHLDDDDDNYNSNMGSRKGMFLAGRKKVSDFLRQYDKDVLKKYGIGDKEIEQWDKDTELYNGNLNKEGSYNNPEGYDLNDYESGQFKGFDNDNSRRIYYFLADIGNSRFFSKNSKGNEYYTKDEKGKTTKFQGIPLGENVTKG